MQILFLLLFSLASLASPTDTVVDYLRSTPAVVNGEIKFDTQFTAYQGKYGLLNANVFLEPKEAINFHFNEDFLNIYSEEGIVLTIGGLPVKIKSIDYNPKTKEFKVQSSTLTGLLEGTYNKEVEERLNKLYLPKMEKAFRELAEVRKKKKLGDVRQVMRIITDIFSDSGKSALPGLEGNIELVFHPETDKALSLDDLVVDVKAKDRFGVELKFTRRDRKIQVNHAELKSQKGIVISGKTSIKELASLDFHQLDLTNWGIMAHYSIGAEDVIGGLILTMKIFEAQYTGLPPDCDISKLPKFPTFREELDAKFKFGISQLIRENEAELLDAGVSPKLIKALL